MNKEFNLDQRIAQYEMARDEVGQIDVQEKVEQIKTNLMAEVLLDFLRVEDRLIDLSSTKEAEIRVELYRLFHQKVDPEYSVDYAAIVAGLSRSQKVFNFLWGERRPRIVDQLSIQSLVEAMAIKKNIESVNFKQNFHRMYFMPPMDRVDAFSMAAKLHDIGIDIMLPTDDEGFQDVKPQPRPDHLYSISLEPSNFTSIVYTANRSFADVAKDLETDGMCGLTIQEYLFWLADKEGKISDQEEVQTILFDERFADFSLLQVIWDNNILRIRPARTYNGLTPMLALKGWGDRDV